MTLREQLAAAPSSTAYQRIVLERVVTGGIHADWELLTIRRLGHVVEIDVLATPLGIYDDPSDDHSIVYVMVSATLQQLVLDRLGALLPTPLIMDEMWRSASAKVPPFERDWWKDGSMGSPARLLEQSQAIGDLLRRTPPGILGLPWKSWVLVKELADGLKLEGSEQAYNHGLYLESGGDETEGGFHAIQVRGGRHGRLEVDYSQVVLGMMGRCRVDGIDMSTADVLRDPVLGKLLAYDGPLSVVRQPGTYDEHAFTR